MTRQLMSSHLPLTITLPSGQEIIVELDLVIVGPI